jgi:hypothetical protein
MVFDDGINITVTILDNIRRPVIYLKTWRLQNVVLLNQRGRRMMSKIVTVIRIHLICKSVWFVQDYTLWTAYRLYLVSIGITELNNWIKGCGKKWSWLYLRCYVGICLEEPKKKHENAQPVQSVSQQKELLNTNRKLCSLGWCSRWHSCLMPVIVGVRVGTRIWDDE